MIADAVTSNNFIGRIIQEELPGLCETCANRFTCVFKLNANKIILQCELFEVEESVPTPFLSIASRSHNKKLISSLKGLCGNCSNVPYCQLPKAEGGVWHCEEYH